MKLLLYIGLLWAALPTRAAEKCFEAFDQQNQKATVLCVGRPYTFQDCGNEVPDENEYYIFNYKKGTPITNASDDQTHTYTAPGTYRVLQVANYGSNTLTDTVSVVYEVKATPAPDFNVSTCANGKVAVDIRDTNYTFYMIEYGDGQRDTNVQPGSSSVEHTYATAGTYRVKVTGAYEPGACTGSAEKQVTAYYATQLPLLSRLTVQKQGTSERVQLELRQLQPGSIYLVQQWQQNAARFATIDTIRTLQDATLTNALTHLLTNINTTNAVHYRIQPVDACGSASPGSTPVSLITLEATSGNELVTLKWKNMPFASSFRVYRNGVKIKTLTSSASQYADQEVTCNMPYQYVIQGIAADSSVSVSAVAEVLVTSTATPSAPAVASTYNPENQVVLTISRENKVTAGDGNFAIERSQGQNGKYQPLANVQELTYIDALSAPGPYCFRTTYTNACANSSDYGNVTCPVFLQAEQLRTETAIQLDWSAYKGPSDASVVYSLEMLDANGNVLKAFPTTGTTYKDINLNDNQQQRWYRTKGTLRDGSVTYSNTVLIELAGQLFIPSAFTPNNDGLNDTFVIKGRFFTGYQLKVYNRGGNLIYQGTDADLGWDGTFQGKLLPAGVYAYEVTVTENKGTEKRHTGTVSLLR
ncbi:T9SS type B sorting domain-containing protein [Pontibacter sp. CAU 1760]